MSGKSQEILRWMISGNPDIVYEAETNMKKIENRLQQLYLFKNNLCASGLMFSLVCPVCVIVLVRLIYYLRC